LSKPKWQLAPRAASGLKGLARPVVWRDGSVIDLGGGPGGAAAINDKGQIAGWLRADPNFPWTFHATLWESSGTTDLGTLGGANSWAYAISAEGRVAGMSDTPTGEQHAFVWDSSGGMRDLGTLGGPLSVATGIQDRG
jgi:probable HAF family extracellular repeat protein